MNSPCSWHDAKLTSLSENLQKRLDLGRKRYGHGVRIHDDTTQFGTPSDSWFDMMLEEVFDAMIYIGCARLRDQRRESGNPDDNEAVLTWIQETLSHECERDIACYAFHTEFEDILRKLFGIFIHCAR